MFFWHGFLIKVVNMLRSVSLWGDLLITGLPMFVNLIVIYGSPNLFSEFNGKNFSFI
jgi:hypothetical protein